MRQGEEKKDLKTEGNKYFWEVDVIAEEKDDVTTSISTEAF